MFINLLHVSQLIFLSSFIKWFWIIFLCDVSVKTLYTLSRLHVRQDTPVSFVTEIIFHFYRQSLFYIKENMSSNKIYYDA